MAGCSVTMAHLVFQFLVFFERVLERNFSKFGVWIAHKEITIADLRLYQLHMWLGGKFGACLHGDRLDGMPDDILSGFPLLDLHRERVEEIAEVMAFRSRFSWPYSTFYFNPGEAADDEDAYAFRIEDNSKVPRITLTHASKTVNVEPIRLAAVIGKVREIACLLCIHKYPCSLHAPTNYQLPFTNKLVEPESEEWETIYERRFTVKQLPVLEIENPGLEKEFFTQPIAILRYICKLGSLYPINPIRALEVESMIETIAEIQKLVNIALDGTLQTFMSGSPWSENEVWSVRRRIAKNNEQGLPYVSELCPLSCETLLRHPRQLLTFCFVG
jgi:glutathione S-transferase